MALPILKADALESRPDGVVLRLSLPWIRSLPIASLRRIVVSLDGCTVEEPRIRLHEGDLVTARLGSVDGWWFLQDRLILCGLGAVDPGVHDVAVSFQLRIPYLLTPSGDPLDLSFEDEQTLVRDAPTVALSVSRDVS